MNGIKIISLPEVVMPIPEKWRETPSVEARTGQAAQANFKNWSNKQLHSLLNGLEIGIIVSVIGGCLASFMVGIPSLLIGGVAVIACLIGRSAVKRAEMTRIQESCLEVERALKEIKQSFDQINDCIQKLPKNVDFNDDLDLYLPIFHELREAIESLPFEDNYKQLVEKLNQQQIDFLGSSPWLSVGLKTSFRLSVRSMYVISDELHGKLKLEYFDKYFLFAVDDFKDRCWIMRDSREERMHYENMGAGAEFWRQNLAAFRSSLVTG
jgi:hypothetical protein